jgi:hypothetical protein
MRTENCNRVTLHDVFLENVDTVSLVIAEQVFGENYKLMVQDIISPSLRVGNYIPCVSIRFYYLLSVRC